MAKWWRGLIYVAAEINSSAYLFHRSSSFFFHRYHTIQAIPREWTGRGVSAREREAGRIPAVVLAQSMPVPQKEPSRRCESRKRLLTTEKKQIESIVKSVELPFFCSTTFQLQIRAGPGSSTLLESGRVLPIKLHRNEETGKILNLVLVWADDGEQLKVDIPVVFRGLEDCPGLKKGGHLKTIRKSLKFQCPAEHVPSKIEVDVGKLDIEDGVWMRDIVVHPSLKLLSKNETMPVCKIVVANPTGPEEAVIS